VREQVATLDEFLNQVDGFVSIKVGPEFDDEGRASSSVQSFQDVELLADLRDVLVELHVLLVRHSLHCVGAALIFFALNEEDLAKLARADGGHEQEVR